MLQSKRLSLNFWAEEINCENYILNHTPTKVLRNVTPEEPWCSIKPDVKHFRVFGSDAWAHIPDVKHKALEPKSEKCIFVRYFEDVKGYRLLQPKSKNIIIRRDVKFDENILACEPSSASVPPLAYEPDSAYVPPLSLSSIFNSIPSSSNDDCKDDNPPPSHEIVHYTPLLPRWVRSTWDAAGSLAGDPAD